MTVSVIMPARNAERTVERAVRSCLRGLRAEDRIFVLDDRSDDATADRVKSIRDRRVVMLGSTGEGGLVSSLNELLECAVGQYVARMDADDVALRWRFAYQRDRLAKGQADITFGNVIHFGERTVPRPSDTLLLRPDDVSRLLLVANPLSHPTMFGRLDRVRELGGYRRSIAEDYDLWLRAAAAGLALERTGVPVLLYRHHAGQVTAQAGWPEKINEDSLLGESRRALASQVFPRWSSREARDLDLSAIARDGRERARTIAGDLFVAERGARSRILRYGERVLWRTGQAPNE
jgi:glycosyltransferase involved in cell wall biosynthesis